MDTQPPDEQTATDASALARLKRFGGAKLLLEMIRLYRAAAPERVAAARSALESGDIDSVELALHSLKSSSLQLGATRMGMLSEKGEIVARSGTLDGVREIVSALEDELVRVHDWLAGIQQGESA